MVPAKETCSSSMVTCRPSAARAASSAARLGSNLATAASTSRSTAVAEVRCANGASCASTYAAASRDRSAWMVVSATRRARHAGRSPACTRRHNRGSRCRSSRACPTSRFADTVEIPRTAPSSLMQNSATNGAPTPATGSSCSPPPGMTNAAAPSTESAGCRSAHAHAATSSSASARSAVTATRPRVREHRGRGVGKLASGDRHTRSQPGTTDISGPDSGVRAGWWTTIRTSHLSRQPGLPRA